MNDRKLHKIFRSLIANKPEELEFASNSYTEVNFDRLRLSGVFQDLGRKIQNSYPTLGGPPSTQTLANQAEKDGDTELSLLVQEISSDDFIWGPNFTALLSSYLDDLKESHFREIINNASQICSTGLKIDKEVKKGINDALDYLTAEAVGVKSWDDKAFNIITSEDAPDIIREEYRIAKEQKLIVYGGTGIENIDKYTGGIHPGELWLLAGYTSAGKTTFAMNWVTHLNTVGGWNIFVYSLEMLPKSLWRILACIHSNNQKFSEAGYSPVNPAKIKSGTLTPEEEQFIMDVVLPDLRDNPNHGKIIVEQPSQTPSMEEVWARAEAYNRREKLDMVVIDYIALLTAKQVGGNKVRYDRINENIKTAKRMAMNFDRNEGICVVSPHQISRDGMQRAAQNDGVYDLRALADTAEAERNADVIYAMYQDERLRSLNESLFSPLKNRDGEIAEPFRVYCDQRYRFFSNLRQEDYVVE